MTCYRWSSLPLVLVLVFTLVSRVVLEFGVVLVRPQGAPSGSPLIATR